MWQQNDEMITQDERGFFMYCVCLKNCWAGKVFLRCQADVTMFCVMAPARCVFNGACDLWSGLNVLKGVCEEALLKWDNRTWSKGSPLVGGRCALTSLPLFTVHLLSACAPFMWSPIPSQALAYFLCAAWWWSWPGRLGWKSSSYCQECTMSTGAIHVSVFGAFSWTEDNRWSFMQLLWFRNSLLTSAPIQRLLTVLLKTQWAAIESLWSPSTV